MGYKKDLNLCFISEDNYALLGGIALCSLLENNRLLDEINVFWIDCGISKERLDKLSTIVEKYDNAKIQFIDGVHYLDELEELGVNSWNATRPYAWVRVVALEDLPIFKGNVLYLDCDCLILDSLSGLINTELYDNTLGMCLDPGPGGLWKTELGFVKDEPYFQSNLLFVDIEKWRAANVSNKLKDDLNKGVFYPVPDQDFLNITFRGKIRTLPFEYNWSEPNQSFRRGVKKHHPFYTWSQMASVYYSPKITAFKPNEVSDNAPLKLNWLYYYNLSPFSGTNYPKYSPTILSGAVTMLEKTPFVGSLVRSILQKRHRSKIMKGRVK